jgi:hypothetical protein
MPYAFPLVNQLVSWVVKQTYREESSARANAGVFVSAKARGPMIGALQVAFLGLDAQRKRTLRP